MVLSKGFHSQYPLFSHFGTPYLVASNGPRGLKGTLSILVQHFPHGPNPTSNHAKQRQVLHLPSFCVLGSLNFIVGWSSRVLVCPLLGRSS